LANNALISGRAVHRPINSTSPAFDSINASQVHRPINSIERI